jgi:hypothetical protein
MMAVEDVGLVQGKKASDIEMRVAISLDKFHWDYTFQYSAMGGRQVRGGTVIDFLVNTVPLQTPLYVMGEYFHGTIQAERDRLTMLLLSTSFHGIFNQPVVLLGADLQTQEASDEAVTRLFGRVQ